MRSESRTEDTSGIGDHHRLVGEGQRHHGAVLDAGGESQTMKSKPWWVSSASTRSTPSSSLEGVLVRVCEPAAPQVVAVFVLDQRLGEGRLAVDDVDQVIDHAAPQPMMRSRLRRPTSKSMTTVLKPRMARPVAKLALVVVLPTPPFAGGDGDDTGHGGFLGLGFKRRRATVRAMRRRRSG